MFVRRNKFEAQHTIKLDFLILCFHNNDNITSQIDHTGGFQKGQVEEFEYITGFQGGIL